jgi:hypothetical protein
VLGDICAGKNVTSIPQLIHNLREMGSAANLFIEVLLLLRLYLVLPAGIILSVQSNQNVKSKGQNVQSKLEKCAVQK